MQGLNHVYNLLLILSFLFLLLFVPFNCPHFQVKSILWQRHACPGGQHSTCNSDSAHTVSSAGPRPCSLPQEGFSMVWGHAGLRRARAPAVKPFLCVFPQQSDRMTQHSCDSRWYFAQHKGSQWVLWCSLSVLLSLHQKNVPVSSTCQRDICMSWLWHRQWKLPVSVVESPSD